MRVCLTIVFGLLVAGLAYLGFGLAPSYPAMLVALAFVGLANAVFHPADYALLSAKIAPARLGRAFSIHTFARFLGNAVAPVTMIALAAGIGLNIALMAAGILALVVAVPLMLASGVETQAAPAPQIRPAAPVRRILGDRVALHEPAQERSRSRSSDIRPADSQRPRHSSWHGIHRRVGWVSQSKPGGLLPGVFRPATPGHRCFV